MNAAPEQRRQAEFAASAESIAEAVDFALAAIPERYEDERHAVELALSEAIGNLLRHGFAGLSPQQASFQLVTRSSEAACEFQLHDRGHRIPAKALERELDRDVPTPDPDDPQTWNESGFGLTLIKRTMDEVRYFSDAEGNHLYLRRKLGNTA